MTETPLRVEDYIERGAALYMEDKYDAAQIEFEAALALDPNDAKAHAGLGLVYSKKTQTETATQQLERALAMDPACAWAYYGRGNLLVNDSKYAEATVEYLQASGLDPQLAWPHFGLAVVSQANQQVPEAIKEYEEAIRLAPNWAAAHYNLGYIFSTQENDTDAITHYKIAITYQPTWAKASYALAAVYFRLEQYEDAAQAFRQAIEKDPTWSPAYLALGLTYRKQKKFEDAILQLQKSAALQPSWEEPHNSLGDIYTTLKNRKKAISSFRLALQLTDSTQLNKQRNIAWKICMAHLLPFKSWALSAVVWLFPTLLLLILSPFLIFGVFGSTGAASAPGWPVYIRWLPTIVLGFIGVGWFLTAWLSHYRLGRWSDTVKLGFIYGALMLALRSPLYSLTFLAFSLFPIALPPGFVEIFASISLLIGTAMLVVTHRIEQEERGVIYSLPEAVAFVLILGGISLVSVLMGIWSSLPQLLPASVWETGSFLILLVVIIYLNSLLDKTADWLTKLLTDAVIRGYKRTAE